MISRFIAIWSYDRPPPSPSYIQPCFKVMVAAAPPISFSLTTSCNDITLPPTSPLTLLGPCSAWACSPCLLEAGPFSVLQQFFCGNGDCFWSFLPRSAGLWETANFSCLHARVAVSGEVSQKRLFPFSLLKPSLPPKPNFFNKENRKKVRRERLVDLFFPPPPIRCWN